MVAGHVTQSWQDYIKTLVKHVTHDDYLQMDKRAEIDEFNK